MIAEACSVPSDLSVTFASLGKKIATDTSYRNHIRIEIETMRLATEKEKERLSEYSNDEDGMVDQPFLTADTVKE